MKADIVIVGGGASGYSSALAAKKVLPDIEVVIVEKLHMTGKKLIATGNGKCNLSNTSISEKNYHGSVNATSIIGNTPDWYELFVRELGVMCVCGSGGREGGIYPYSNSAMTVREAFRIRLNSIGVKEVCDFEVKNISGNNGSFIISGENSEIVCKRVIVATGGYASPSFGTDGSVMRIFKNMGYRISKICPAVAPLRVRPESVKGLKGVRAKGRVSAVACGKILRTETGEIQFNENNISGICVFNLAYLFQQYEGKLTLRLDLTPETDYSTLVDYLKGIRKNRLECGLAEILTGLFTRRLAEYIVKNTLCRPMTDTVKNIDNGEIKKLAEKIKCLEFEVTGCSAWQTAQATCGGIHNDCITENLESRTHRGIYFCGEILDTVGDCGGFNLQWAWSSGMWAGRKCAESLKG